MMRHRKQLISFIICERMFSQQNENIDKVSPFAKISVEETERLKHLIKSRFITTQTAPVQLA